MVYHFNFSLKTPKIKKFKDVIELVISQACDIKSYSNFQIHSNKMIFDDNKKLIGFDDSNIYHSFNKEVHLLPYSEKFLNKNVILLGDSLQVSFSNFFLHFSKKHYVFNNYLY